MVVDLLGSNMWVKTTVCTIARVNSPSTIEGHLHHHLPPGRFCPARKQSPKLLLTAVKPSHHPSEQRRGRTGTFEHYLWEPMESQQLYLRCGICTAQKRAETRCVQLGHDHLRASESRRSLDMGGGLGWTEIIVSKAMSVSSDSRTSCYNIELTTSSLDVVLVQLL